MAPAPPPGPVPVRFGRRVPEDRRAALAFLVGGALTLIVGPVIGGSMLAVIAGLMGVGAGFWMLGRGEAPFRDAALQPLTVIVRHGALVSVEEGRTLVDASDVQSGWIEPAGNTAVAVLALRDGTHAAFWADDEPGARAILAAVGADARASTMRLARGTAVDRRGASCLLAALFVPALLFALGYPVFLVLSIILALSEGSCREVTSALVVGGGALPFVLLLAALADRLGETTLRVGRDGVWIDGGVLRRRFLAHVELEDVSAHEATLLLRTPGRDVRIRCGSAEQAAAAAGRIEAARGGSRDAERRTAAEALLARQGDPIDRWRERLRGVLEASSGYREAAIDEDQLAAVVEDPEATPGLRVGAAVALAGSSSPAARERVRIASQAQAEPQLASLLARAAEGDVDEAALAEADHVHAERRLRRALR